MTMLSRFATTGGGGGDPYWNNVSLLLNGDGTNGSTTFTDLSSSPKTITNTGSVTVNTTTKKYGTGSMAFDGTSGKYLQAVIPAFGTGDFTIEMWVNRASGANNGFLQFSSTSSLPGDTAPLAIGCLNNIWLIDCASVGQKQSSVAMTNSTWYHVALVRSSGITKFYINGIVDTFTNFGGSAGLTDTTNYTATYVAIGVWYSAGYTWNGYIDDLRITKGIARYTANFTPPTAPLPIG